MAFCELQNIRSRYHLCFVASTTFKWMHRVLNKRWSALRHREGNMHFNVSSAGRVKIRFTAFYEPLRLIYVSPGLDKCHRNLPVCHRRSHSKMEFAKFYLGVTAIFSLKLRTHKKRTQLFLILRKETKVTLKSIRYGFSKITLFILEWVPIHSNLNYLTVVPPLITVS